jgi:hypothetical protein
LQADKLRNLELALLTNEEEFTFNNCFQSVIADIVDAFTLAIDKAPKH